MRGDDFQPASPADPPAADGPPEATGAPQGAAAAGLPEAAEVADPPEAAPGATNRGQPKALLIGVIVAVLAVIAVLVYLLAQPPERPAAQIPDPVTTTLPVPTPAGDPIEAEASTPLSAAFPEVVLDHVLTSQSEDEQAFADYDALEGWHLTYSAPGSDIELRVLQWDSTDAAAAYVEEVLADRYDFADGEGRRSGDVAVDGEAVGRYEIGVLSGQEEPDEASTPADPDAEPVATPEPLGPGMAVWTNGTVALVASGDAARVAQFYDNFPF